MTKISFRYDRRRASPGQNWVRLSMQNNVTTKEIMNDGIICATDFSESSKDALRWSVSLASQLKKHLTILFTYRLLNIHNGEIIELKKNIERIADHTRRYKFYNVILNATDRSEPDQSRWFSDLQHNVVTGVNASGTVYTFQLRAIPDINAGRADVNA